VAELTPPYAVVRAADGGLVAYGGANRSWILSAGESGGLERLVGSDGVRRVGFFGYDFLAREMGVKTAARRDLSVPDGFFFEPGVAFATRDPSALVMAGVVGGGRLPRLCCNQRYGEYRAAFEQAQQAILSGNTYQIKISIRFEAAWQLSPLVAFRMLLAANLAPQSFLLVHPDFSMVSCSPELVLDRCGSRLITEPIGGTLMRREGDTVDGVRTRFESDDKEKAEHNMLVDLERNDLSRVCQPGSVRVEAFRQIATYRHVHHLVSRISGTLRGGCGLADVIRAMLPGGTITGCPKHRTMELIDELEPVFRGPYTGSFGVIEPDGDCRLNLIIRTLLVLGRRAFVQAGGGIVVDSTPRYEYRENCLKARSLLELFRGV
jgi:para-aminobenzoate synthetase component 1